MKHIFVVHSHVTFICALAVIVKENIAKEDYLIIGDHYSLNDAPVDIISLSVEPNRALLKTNPIEYFKDFFDPTVKLYKVVDDFLKGDQFIAYVPVFHIMKKMLIVHNSCHHFNFIEEGLSSYYETNEWREYYCIYNNVPWRYSTGLKGLMQRFHHAYRQFGFRSCKYDSMPVLYPAYVFSKKCKFYGLSEYSFPLASDRLQLSLDDVKPLFATESEHKYDNCCFWLGDPNLVDVVGIESYYLALNNYLLPNIPSVLYVKFHYRETDHQRSVFLSFLEKNNVRYVVVPDNTIMELVYMTNENVTNISIISSLLIYSSIFGHRSLSIINGFPKYREEVLPQVPVFEKLVSLL